MYFTDPYLLRDPLRMTRGHLLERSTAPASEPITLIEAKLYLRVDHANEDTLVSDLITASRMMAEGWLSRSLMPQSWKLAYDDGIAECIALPMGPVTGITSVTVFASDGTSQAINASYYWLNAAKNALVMNSALLGFRVEIIYATGYASAGDIPRPIRQGMLAHIAAMYDNRGDAALPDQAAILYAPYREVRL